MEWLTYKTFKKGPVFPLSMSFDELLRTTALAARECTLFERLRALYEAKPGMQEAIVVGALGTKLLADPSFKHRLPEATDIDLLFGTIPGNLRDELASRFLIDKAEREYASMGMEVKERLIESPHKVYGFKDPKYEHIDIFDGNVGPVQLPEGLVHPTLRINEEQSITLKIGNPGFLLANYLAAATPKRLGRTRVLLETLASANKW